MICRSRPGSVTPSATRFKSSCPMAILSSTSGRLGANAEVPNQAALLPRLVATPPRRRAFVVIPLVASPPVTVVVIPASIGLWLAIAIMPVHQIPVQRVRPPFFPIGVTTMDLQKESTLSSPACSRNVRSAERIFAAGQAVLGHLIISKGI